MLNEAATVTQSSSSVPEIVLTVPNGPGHQPPQISQHYIRQLDVSVIRVFVDVVGFAALGLAVLYFQLLASPHLRGFYCDDTSIAQSFRPSTVSPLLLYIVATAITVAVVVISELHRCHRESLRERNDVQQRHFIVEYRFPGNKIVHRFFVRFYRYFGYYMFGALCNNLFTDTLKFSVGRLRPNFLDVCNLANDTLQLCHTNPQAYVTPEQTHCLNPNTRDNRLSFPSGHSSFSLFAAVFLIVYVQSRAEWRVLFGGSGLPQRLFQMFMFMFALLVCVSRINDHKHHPTDVIGGIVVGSVVGLVTVVYFARSFSRRARSFDEQDIDIYPLRDRSQTAKTSETDCSNSVAADPLPEPL